ncbi:tRNA 5-methoxyuridine(34)/uridine 5-oxyacetic acid(34) synthase CmoB [Lentisphaerota bacterium WC36G]|nr:tRNA 5-methoxyuridine(34)/uridine 5-oxyacetic acid(34) synthase CmoB [Lentisphaerae bacterium WC36]
MLDYSYFFKFLCKEKLLRPFCDELQAIVENKVNKLNHGDKFKWLYAIKSMPELKTTNYNFSQKAVTVGKESELDQEDLKRLYFSLKMLFPWRKGPFNICGIDIDTEWRSDLKWDRLKDKISTLKDRNILDIGCGSGYHCFRMLGEEAKTVTGIDPYWTFVMQFHAISKYVARDLPIAVLPLGIEELPKDITGFDTVFSMGVLYHRRSPIDHLIELKNLLRAGGELVLETIVTYGDENSVFVPPGRYASMNNVWFIPSVKALKVWLEKVGFKDVEVLDVEETSINEQRTTNWMPFKSLPDFLDENDKNLTIEGHVAPIRAVLKATK